MKTVIATSLLLVLANVCAAQTARQVEAAKYLATHDEVEAAYNMLNRLPADDVPPEARAALAELVTKAQKVHGLYEALRPYLESVVAGDESKETLAIIDTYLVQVPSAQREKERAFEEFKRAAGLK